MELAPNDKVRIRKLPWKAMALGLLAAMAVGAMIWRFSPLLFGTPVVLASEIRISTAVANPLVEFVSVRGSVVPMASVTLSATISGQVKEIFVAPGDNVVSGQPIVRLSNSALELEVLTAETQATEQVNSQRALQVSLASSISQSKLAVVDTKYQIAQLRAELDRATVLADRGVGTIVRRDELAGQVDYQENRLQLLETAVREDISLSDEVSASIGQNSSLLSEVAERRRAQLDALLIRAPSAGQIGSFDLTVGEQIGAGSPVATVDGESGFKVRFTADEFYLPRIALDQEILLDAAGEGRLRVTQILPGIVDGQISFDAQFQTPLPGLLRRGQALSGKVIVSDDGSKPLSLPVGPYLQQTGGSWVFVVDEPGMAHRREIQVGRRTPELIEIISGLRAGDQVITSSYSLFLASEALRIQ
ncbi:hypothetical protein ASE94_01670 [Devosia sp. Leaf64]|nr:hypothetical protein ASE94_01670 [Devosia sp. Leaf64]